MQFNSYQSTSINTPVKFNQHPQRCSGSDSASTLDSQNASYSPQYKISLFGELLFPISEQQLFKKSNNNKIAENMNKKQQQQIKSIKKTLFALDSECVQKIQQDHEKQQTKQQIYELSTYGQNCQTQKDEWDSDSDCEEMTQNVEKSLIQMRKKYSADSQFSDFYEDFDMDMDI